MAKPRFTDCLHELNKFSQGILIKSLKDKELGRGSESIKL